MDFKEYLKDRLEYIKNHEDKALIIKIGDGYQYTYRSNWSAEFYEDFVVFNSDDFTCALRYDDITIVCEKHEK